MGRKNQNKLQYYLFDLESYTITKERKTEIEENAKLRLKKLAKEIWQCKQQMENDNEYRFIKSFSYAAFYTPNKISTYIKFDDKGRLKRGCKKYWNYLKRELSKISNVPIKRIIM